MTSERDTAAEEYVKDRPTSVRYPRLMGFCDGWSACAEWVRKWAREDAVLYDRFGDQEDYIRLSDLEEKLKEK